VDDPSSRDNLVDIAASLETTTPIEEPVSRTVRRRLDGAWLGGVCLGLEERLGWPALATRLVFLASSLWLFLGLAVYGGLWLLLPPASRDQPLGVVAASRTGYRTAISESRWTPVVVGVALALYGVGVASLMHFFGSCWALVAGLEWIPRHSFAILGVCLGVALSWRQWDQCDRTSQAGIWVAGSKTVAGLLLAAASVILSTGLGVGWGAAWHGAWIGGATLVVAGLLLAPWLGHPESRLAVREERIREQAKADLAAHLHDSVLQTLATIQRQPEDSKSVARLARRQERELRSWLYGETPEEGSLTAELKATAAEIEDTYGVPVDVVTVGDAELTPTLDVLVRAAREAILNAAKHSGAPSIDVYIEVGQTTAEVFVRDRGKGFDATVVADDRMGLRGSILDRMHRHGGLVSLRSTVGQGTEVHLEMTL